MMKTLTIRRENGVITEEEKDLSTKKAFIFDVDGTLTESKLGMTMEMAETLRILLKTKNIALLGGGAYKQLKEQCADTIIGDEHLIAHSKKILLAPVSGGLVCSYDEGVWQTEYEIQPFTPEEKQTIRDAIQKALDDINYAPPEKVYGEVIEDRDKQITFSALGQEAPKEEKEKWNREQDIRSQLQQALQSYIPDIPVRAGGSTSVDITRTNKAAGIEQISKIWEIKIDDMVFFGDQIREGGNDYVSLETGIDAVRVAHPTDTMNILMDINKQY